MDLVSEQRLEEVMPLLADKIRQMASKLAAQGITIRVVQSLRTNEEQDALYAQGRTAPGKVVTNVKGGYSYHNFGLAVDCVPSLPGGAYMPDWNPQHPVWKQMEATGEALGLDSGSTWRTFPDAPHFQLTGQYPEGEPSDNLRALASVAGLRSVWESISLWSNTTVST